VVCAMSDTFNNFEGLQRRLNLTHFDDEREIPPSEDFLSRPDVVRAKEMVPSFQAEFGPDNYLHVALYFHPFPWHLQSFREALQVRRADTLHGTQLVSMIQGLPTSHLADTQLLLNPLTCPSLASVPAGLRGVAEGGSWG
jgi:hypothetical protein